MTAGFAPDLGSLLAPLSVDGPAGPSLRYDPAYARIRDARSEDDASLPMGEWTRPLKKADWRAVETLCTEVLHQRSKDLQVAAWLTEAWVHRHALAGLVAGTRLIEGLARDFWDGVHPLIEDGDTEMRAAALVWANNTLAQALLLHVPLVPWPEPARPFVNLADWQRALSSEFGVGDARAKAASAVLASRQEILDQAAHDLPALVAIDEALVQASAAWDELTALLDAQLGADAPSMSKVADTLQQLRQAVRSLLLGRDPRDQAAAAPARAPSTDAAAQTPPAPTPTPTPTLDEHPMSEEESLPPLPVPSSQAAHIGSRAQAYELLERAAAYLKRAEPHSPTPYLIERAVTWGRMPLPELMQEVMREEGDLNRFFSMLGMKRD